MACDLPYNVLKCGNITPEEDEEYNDLKQLMTTSPDLFKLKIQSISRTAKGYNNVIDYIQRDPFYHNSLLKRAITFKMYDIIQWFCDEDLLHVAARLYSTKFLSLAIPNQVILRSLLNYGFSTFLKPIDFSMFSFRQVSPLIHSIAYLDYDFVKFMTSYHCIMPNIQIILTNNSIHNIYRKSILPMENIILFINKRFKKLYKVTMFENHKRQKFFAHLPYIAHVDGIPRVRNKISFKHELFQQLIQIIHLLYSKGSSISFSHITDGDNGIPLYMISSNAVYKSYSIKKSVTNLNFLHKTFTFTSSPRSLQRECSNTIKTYILLRSGICNFKGKVESLPLTSCTKELITL
jgi:hypothetical protein